MFADLVVLFFVDSPKSRMTGFARPQDTVCASIIDQVAVSRADVVSEQR
jgi:hypothetical protein